MEYFNSTTNGVNETSNEDSSRLEDNSSRADILRNRSHKKNGFRRLPSGANHERFIAQVKQNLQAIVVGDLDGASMVRRHPRTGAFCVRIGFGGKNEYVQNDFHPKDEYIEYVTTEEVEAALQVILKMGINGEFDEPLEQILIKRQEIADRLVRAQKDRKGTFGRLASEAA